MARSLVAFGLVAALLSAGCVPVTEPVGDVEKAKPDKALVGTWTVTKGRGLAGAIQTEPLTFDTPVVKGNPKGLMRAVMKQDAENPMWFFTTKVGKHTYATVLLAMKDGDPPPKFDKEGTFAKWKEGTGKRYFVFQYARDGDALTIDCGDIGAFSNLMRDQQITGSGEKPIEFFDTPAGWFAKYFSKNKPGTVFNGTNSLALEREKK